MSNDSGENSQHLIISPTNDSLVEMNNFDNIGYETPKKQSLTNDNQTENEIEINILNSDKTASSSCVDDETDLSDEGCCNHILNTCTYYFELYYVKHKEKFLHGFYIILFLLYVAYLTAAIVIDFKGSIFLITITAIIFLYLFCYFVHQKFSKQFSTSLKSIKVPLKQKLYKFKWIFFLMPFAALLIFLILDSILYNLNRLVSLVGLIVLIIFLFLFSKYPRKVHWQPVIWGLTMQFILGLLVLRWSWGYVAFKFLGDQMNIFFSYTDEGAKFVFGANYTDHFFAFKVLPVVIFFSCFISILYHLGVMQIVIGNIAWVMRKTLGTTGPESVNAAGNIFVGQTEAPLLISPFLNDMTKSELHAVMTGGFATIAGTVMAAYILFKIPAIHLISASVMAAPAALAVSKLFYPETEKEHKRENNNEFKMASSNHRNVIEAASAGASNSIGLVANIGANLIAFLSMLALLNSVLSYLGARVGFPELSFQMICSYIFTPFAFLMGISWKDCSLVAGLLGTKTFINEFVAYEQLSGYIKNRENGVFPQLSIRSETIVTYALCSFANLSSVGIQLGGLGALIPQRKSDLAEIVIRALIAGTLTNYMTACIAGILITDASHGLEVNSTIAPFIGNISL